MPSGNGGEPGLYPPPKAVVEIGAGMAAEAAGAGAIVAGLVGDNGDSSASLGVFTAGIQPALVLQQPPLVWIGLALLVVSLVFLALAIIDISRGWRDQARRRDRRHPDHPPVFEEPGGDDASGGGEPGGGPQGPGAGGPGSTAS